MHRPSKQITSTAEDTIDRCRASWPHLFHAMIVNAGFDAFRSGRYDFYQPSGISAAPFPEAPQVLSGDSVFPLSLMPSRALGYHFSRIAHTEAEDIMPPPRHRHFTGFYMRARAALYRGGHFVFPERHHHFSLPAEVDFASVLEA